MTFFRSHIGSTLRASRSAWHARILATLLATIALMVSVAHVHAATTTPQTMVYNARLLNRDGTPLTEPVKIRFSLWKSADALDSDTASGAINTGSSNYVYWQEVQTVNSDVNGYFSVTLGSGSALPTMNSLPVSTLLSLYLQVEVKKAAQEDASYELLDPKPFDPTADRSPLLSVPFALNADRLDQRDVGTGSGSIPFLGSGGLLPVSAVPGGTRRDTFTIDADNTASSSLTLKFGEMLSKTLLYSITNNRFEFNADVRVQGNLTVTGLINGTDLTSVSVPPLHASSGGGLTVKVFSGSYRINGNIMNFTGTSATLPNNTDSYIFFTGTGLVKRSSGFPTNVSFIPVAKVRTASGGVRTVTDLRVLQSDNRENSILNVLHPEFKDAAYQGDGADNVGQLSASNDTSSKKNFYLWASSRSTLQDYDVVLRVTLPEHFVRWSSNPITLNYRTSTSVAADNKLDVQVFDTAGNAVSITGGGTLVANAWATSGITYSGSPMWTAGQTFLVKIKVSSKSNNQAHIGDLELRYVELEKQ